MLVDFGNFGDVQSDMASLAANVQVIRAKVKTVLDNTYVILPSTRAKINGWNDRVGLWLGTADQRYTISNDPERLKTWIQLGQQLGADGVTYMQDLGQNEIAGMIGTTLVRMPASFVTVVTTTAKAVATAVEVTADEAALIAKKLAKGAGEVPKELGKGLGITLLYVGGALALVSYLLKKSGTSIGIGPFKIGK